MKFRDRTYAALLLADELKSYKDSNAVVLAVPRGGVPIGYQLSKMLHLPLDIILCKKIGHPQNPECAIGAVCLDDIFIDTYNQSIPEDYIKSEIKRIQNRLKEQENTFLLNRSALSIESKAVILTDDGIATGKTLAACVKSLKKRKPQKIIIATPVASRSSIAELTPLVDEIVCIALPADLYAIGQFYEYFPQLTDKEVTEMLANAAYATGSVPSNVPDGK